MSPHAISVEGIGKRYALGSSTSGDRLSEAVVQFLKARWPSRGRRRAQDSGRSADREFWALRDVSFEVQAGQVTGIVGRNGAGKSTLLKILARVTEPTEGRAVIRGRVGSLLEVGTGFHSELTGVENIYLNGAMLGMRRSEIRTKLPAILDFAEIAKFIDTPVKRYSSGMYMRLAFAVAAHLDPEILIVDEVLAVGDAAFQKKCLERMESDAKGGRTILFVSHNMTAVQALCSEVVLLEQGRIALRGTPRQVVDHYLGGDSDRLERVWKDAAQAPGQPYVALSRCAIEAEGGGAIREVNRDEPFVLRIDFENFTPDIYLNLTIFLVHTSGVVAFVSFSKVERYPVGRFSATCEIPARLLNDGLYTIRLLVVRDAAPISIEDHVLGFHVRDPAARVDWYGDFPGVVRPDLKWAVEPAQ